MTSPKQLKRQKLGIAKTEDGRYMIMSPQHKGLVLSGGGAKGIAYGGMINAMDTRGYLRQITHVSGASAGAMTASVLAVGMSSQDIGKLVSALDPTKLLDKSGMGRVRAKGDRFRNMLDVIYMLQIKQHLDGLEKPIPKEVEKNYIQLTTKLALYEQALTAQGLSIKSVDDIIKLSQSAENLEKLDKAFKNIPITASSPSGKKLENSHFTLGDLKLLRELLPEKDKHLIKNLSVAVTNQSKNQLERYSEDSEPQQSIAEVVQWSGAHPALFSPQKNAKGEYVADGGILDNMPEIDGLDREEVLCVKAETESSYEGRVKKAEKDAPETLSGFKKALDYMVQFSIGGKWLNATASLLNREKVFHHIDNMIYINTGAVTTTNTSPTQAQKEQAIQNGFEQTMALLNNHRKTFDHPLLAVLYLGFDQLDKTLVDVKVDPDLFKAAAQAKMIAYLQEQMIREMNAGDYTDIKTYLKQIEDILETDAEMDSEQQEKALSLCHKQVNFLSEGKLVNYLNEVAAEELAAQQPSWGTRALQFILRPIEWVFSLIKSASPVQEPAPKEIELTTLPSRSNYKGKLSMFSPDSSKQVSEDPESDASISPSR